MPKTREKTKTDTHIDTHFGQKISKGSFGCLYFMLLDENIAPPDANTTRRIKAIRMGLSTLLTHWKNCENYF